MKFAFFPGCVLKGAAAEAYTSMQKVCDALGIELEEIPNWTCCGASHAQGVNDLAALAVNARNISIAENMGLPILTVCNTCTLQLRTAKYHLDDNVGARHAKAIYDDIQESGTLDESKLNIKSEGFFLAGLRAPMALRLMRVGKMNPLESHPVNPEVKTVAAIVKAAEKEEE